MNLPRLSVIIVEFNCVEQIDGCVCSLVEHLQGVDWECIVVSNSGYSSRELKVLQGRWVATRVIGNDRNRGYAGGVNTALAACDGPWVLVLNPDCRILNDGMRDVIKQMVADERIGMVGPRIIDNLSVVQPSCRRFPRPWTFLFVRSAVHHFAAARQEQRRYLMGDFKHDGPQDVDWISGGAMLVRRSAIAAVGPMDERFFLYMEDVDWCRRFWRAGWSVRFSPVCTILHDAQHQSLRGGVSRIVSPHTRYHLISLLKYLLKYRGRSERPRASSERRQSGTDSGCRPPQ